MKYTQTKPCNMCPFTKSTNFKFTREKAIAIATQDGGFCCHKTATVDEEDGGYEPTEKSQACAGRLIMLEREGMPDQMMRIAERLGLYDRTKLDMENKDAFKSIKQFLKARVER